MSGRPIGPAGHNVSTSEGYSPGKLNNAREIVLTGDLAELGTPTLRWIELRSIEQVEELTSELKAISTIRAELRVFEGGKVKVLLSVSAYVWLRTRICAITVIRRVAGSEYCSVVPHGELLVF